MRVVGQGRSAARTDRAGESPEAETRPDRLEARDRERRGFTADHHPGPVPVDAHVRRDAHAAIRRREQTRQLHGHRLEQAGGKAHALVAHVGPSAPTVGDVKLRGEQAQARLLRGDVRAGVGVVDPPVEQQHEARIGNASQVQLQRVRLGVTLRAQQSETGNEAAIAIAQEIAHVRPLVDDVGRGDRANVI